MQDRRLAPEEAENRASEVRIPLCSDLQLFSILNLGLISLVFGFTITLNSAFPNLKFNIVNYICARSKKYEVDAEDAASLRTPPFTPPKEAAAEEGAAEGGGEFPAGARRR